MKQALKNFGTKLLGYADAAEKALNNGITTFEGEYPNVSLKAIGIFSSSLLFLKALFQYNLLGRTLISATMMVAAFFTNKDTDTPLSKVVNFFTALATGTFLTMAGPFISVALAAAIGTAAFITRMYHSPSESYAKTAAQIVVPAALFAAPYEMSFLLLATAMVKCSVDYYKNPEAPSLKDAGSSVLTTIKGSLSGIFFRNTPEAASDKNKNNTNNQDQDKTNTTNTTNTTKLNQ